MFPLAYTGFTIRAITAGDDNSFSFKYMQDFSELYDGAIHYQDMKVGEVIDYLRRRELLDKTLVVVSTEFGRPPEFDGGGGRGHYSKAFSVVFAGGGLKTGQAVGETGDMAKKILKQPVSVPDLFATMHCTLGIDPSKNLYAGDRPVPITDEGQPLRQLF